MKARTARSTGVVVATAAAGLVTRSIYDRFRRFEVSESSMIPTLAAGDYVITRRLGRPLRRGDIVVFEHPASPAYFLVKRVIGLPGETVDIHGGRVLIDGSLLTELWTVDDTGPDGRWKLETGQAFVLGDARWLSAGDSRETGPLPVEALSLRVVFRYWPARRLGPVR